MEKRRATQISRRALARALSPRATTREARRENGPRPALVELDAARARAARRRRHAGLYGKTREGGGVREDTRGDLSFSGGRSEENARARKRARERESARFSSSLSRFSRSPLACAGNGKNRRLFEGVLASPRPRLSPRSPRPPREAGVSGVSDGVTLAAA